MFKKKKINHEIEGDRMQFKRLTIALFIVLLAGLLTACLGKETGTLTFRANGEDFVRQGFVSKDGWSIQFDHVYVTLDDVTAYQTEPPYDPHSGDEIEADTKVELDRTFTVDLAEGGPDASPVQVASVGNAPVGHYNAISWEMVPGESGYPLVMEGTAEKDGETIDFTLQVEKEYSYACGDYVGDERKGILTEDGQAEVEMTFHFDHIFGDAEAPMDDDLNMGAPGFEPFAQAAAGGSVEMDMAEMEEALSAEDYQTLVDTLPSLGHVGEGHCHSEVDGE
jgi:hypothetical protein